MRVEDGNLIEVQGKDIKGGRLVLGEDIEGISAGAFCFVEDMLHFITLPSTIKWIQEGAFEDCECLESIVIPEGITRIEDYTFSGCESLRHVKLPKTLKSIGTEAFSSCRSLKEIVFEDNVEIIGEGAFHLCESLASVKFSRNLTMIGKDAFSYCKNLKTIFIPKKVKELSAGAFFACQGLKKVIFKDPNKSKLIKIDACAFLQCGNLESINIPNGVKVIGDKAFARCFHLANVNLPENLEKLGSRVFYDCKAISSITIPKSIKIINEGCFLFCNNLSEVILNEGLIAIKGSSFKETNVSRIDLPNSLEEIDCYAFFDTEVKDIVIPSKVRKVGKYAFPLCLESLSIFHDVEMESSNFSNCHINLVNRFTSETISVLTTLKLNKSLIFDGDNVIKITDGYTLNFFDLDNKWVECSLIDYVKYKGVSVCSKDIRKLYQWKQTGKFLPNMCIMRNMPLEEINNFYINNNHKKWKELLEIVKLSSDEDISGFFKLCYSLGLFSKSGKTSDRAFNFIKRYIVKTEKKNQYHIRFEEMDVYNKKFNKEFAELVYTYYPKQKKKFLIKKCKDGEIKDCFSAVYNNFDLIKKVYRNKVIKTATKKDMLTPQMCMSCINKVEYINILEGNESFAENISLYGYNQDTFDNAQTLFEIGKNIPKDEITLVIAPDNDSALIKYELLEKDNPLGVILGNITNCCQTLNGVARSCVEYGLSKRNSKFMVFRFKNEIIGQSWVWYDEQTHRICLDNIELVKIQNRAKRILIKTALIDCLKRVTDGFLKEMAYKNLPVDSITVGAGFNDISLGLSLHYKKITNQSTMYNYFGYTDAKNQYVLYEHSQQKNGGEVR